MKKRILGAVITMALVFSFFTLFAVDVSAASEMRASEECIKMIQDTEGFRAIPYWDYSQWTVGFGSECPAEDLERYKKEGIPVEEAQALFLKHLERFEKAVNKFAVTHSLNLSQQQFDALVSFTYNLGSGYLNKTSNTIVQAVLNGATENELIYAFSIYCMAGGEFQPGLMRRRLAEANMFLNGQYSEYPPDSFCYIHYDANGGVRDASAQGYDSNLVAVPLSRPTKEGYTFVGWYTAAEGGTKVTSLDETHNGMTLYAHWEVGETQVQTPVTPAQGLKVKVTGSVVHVRSGPGISYGITSDVHAGQILSITGTTEADGLLWGKFSDGWICLDHTNYFTLVPPQTDDSQNQGTLKLPVYATVVDDGGVSVHNGPHSTYPQRKTLAKGKVILIEEYICFAGDEWVRCADGWIRLNTKLLIHDENKLAHDLSVTTNETLVIRANPGTQSSKLGTLSKDSVETVYAVTYVNGEPWGRIAKGWINLSYSDFNEATLDQYQNHIYGEWYSIALSTCISHGTERRDCAYCDHHETREAALGDHSFDAWQVTAQPTCTEDGQEQRICTLCAHVETRAISATGHTMTEWALVLEATCVDAGEEQRKCENCDHTQTRQIAPLGHRFGAWYETKAPTATEFGEEQRDCQACGHSETRQVLPTEHSYGQWYVIREPNCLETGVERRDCQNCDHYEEREVEALGHDLGQWKVTTAPSCTEPGEERRTCQRCDHYEGRPLDSLGHSFGQWYESVAPTYEEQGQERRDCIRCDACETRPIDKLPIPTIIRTYATITCDVLRVRSGPGTNYGQIGKLYKGDRVEILDIETVGGNEWGKTEKGWICLTGYTKLETVEEGPHITHTFGEWYVAQAATCTQDGVSRRDCTLCEHYETEAIAATGHSMGQWYESIAATTTSYGQERRDCENCNHYETRETPMLTVELVTKVYATITCDYLTIRSGAGSSYKRMGKIYNGARVEILEQVTKNGVLWGRTTTGWIWLTGYATLETVTEQVPETQPVLMTVNADSLTVRVAAGTGNAAIGCLYTNAQVLVFETVTYKGALWARTDFGWVMAKYLE